MSVLPPVGGRALDLGCGAGRDSVLLAGRFAHVDAVDLSLPMIEIARAKRSRPNMGCSPSKPKTHIEWIMERVVAG